MRGSISAWDRLAISSPIPSFTLYPPSSILHSPFSHPLQITSIHTHLPLPNPAAIPTLPLYLVTEYSKFSNHLLKCANSHHHFRASPFKPRTSPPNTPSSTYKADRQQKKQRKQPPPKKGSRQINIRSLHPITFKFLPIPIPISPAPHTEISPTIPHPDRPNPPSPTL